jgi:hypothetical protein
MTLKGFRRSGRAVFRQSVTQAGGPLAAGELGHQKVQRGLTPVPHTTDQASYPQESLQGREPGIAP